MNMLVDFSRALEGFYPDLLQYEDFLSLYDVVGIVTPSKHGNFNLNTSMDNALPCPTLLTRINLHLLRDPTPQNFI
jgi:hypothetical protein